MAEVAGAGGLIMNELDRLLLLALGGSTVLAVVAAVFVFNFVL